MPVSHLPLFAESARGLQPIDYLVVLVYLVGVLGVGIVLSKRQHTSEDYFVGGRTMPWFAVGLSLIATLLSTISYLGTPGELIKHGIAQVVGHIAVPIAFAVTIFLWLPFFMRLKLTSVYEYLGLRFGSAARWLGVALFVLILRLCWMAVIVLTSSEAVAQITHKSAMKALHVSWDVNEWTIAVLISVGVFATFYTMLGGIKAVIWTDVAQFVVLFAGALLTIVFVAYETETGPSDWWKTVTAGTTTNDVTDGSAEIATQSDATSKTESTNAGGHEFPPLASWNLAERSTVLWTCMSVFFWYVCTYVSDQVAMQRYFTTPSVGAAVRAGFANFFADISISILLALCGMALLTYYLTFPDRLMEGVANIREANSDKIFPHFIEHGLPVGISGMVVAALFAVAMSSLDSGINSVSTVITVDVLRKLRPQMTSQVELKVARWLTLGIGLGCTTLAVVAFQTLSEEQNIVDITMRTFNCALGPLASMFVVGMFFPHVGQRAVIIAALCGLAVAQLTAWWKELFSIFDIVVDSPSPFLVTPLAFLSALGIAAVLGALLEQPDLEKTRSLSWRAVVFGDKNKETGADES